MKKGPRFAFKEVKIAQGQYLFPLPVIKGNKYLIQVPERFSQFFIYCFEHRILPSPDLKPSYLIQKSVHTDGETIIFSIDPGKIECKLLPHGHLDPVKASQIEAVLTKHIARILTFKEEDVNKLKQAIDKQRKCSTCQKLGIESLQIDELVRLLAGQNSPLR